MPGRALRLNLLALPLSGIFGVFFFLLARQPSHAQKAGLTDRAILVFLLGCPLVLAFHEFVHGVIMRIFGARPRYGFWVGGLMFYAKAPGHVFTRNQYLRVLLGPLVGISLMAGLGVAMLSQPAAVWLAALWGTMNAGAASADVWLTVLVARYPASVRVADERDGIRILESAR